MDVAQTNHLKSYGIAYWSLKNNTKVEWLLNYRGGSFLLNFSNQIKKECLLKSVYYEELSIEEISIGDYVLAGGELGALVIIEAVARLIPGVLGNPESLSEETFSVTKSVIKKENGMTLMEAEYPQYTKPESFMGWAVPAVLRSGNHHEIREWRSQKSIKKN